MLTPLFLFSGLALFVVRGEVCPPSDEFPLCADCGDKMQSFTNLHEMYDAKCDFQHYGYCTANHAPCTLELAPKCAWNGRKFKSFSNPCLLNQFNKFYYDQYVVVSNCPCRDDANS
ncbi:uncharacterized protein LOC106669500 isoform X2 [Cimex lectularius]|uniref:Uncharacterized protein n=1 Tax=Cimex lectularius TaxID=79782 RepID=A0A8I6TG77_CIMLE|nr:uncharacterized protein LOC106669500 isoform X2 [Cimex lectularius]